MILLTIVYLLIGFFIGFMSYFVLNPQARMFDPWGVIGLGLAGSLAGGFAAGSLNIFAINYVSLGSVLMAMLTATLLIWVSAFIKMIFSARPESK